MPGQTESRSGRVSGAAELDLWCALGGREDGGGGLRRPANVAMMQTADFGHLPDPSRLGELDGPDVGGVLVEREMRAGLVVVREVPGQDAAEVSLAEDEHVIQAFAPDGADEPFREGILPRAWRRRQYLLDPNALHAMPKWRTIDVVGSRRR